MHGFSLIGIESSVAHTNSAQLRVQKFSQQLPGLIRNAKEDQNAGKKIKRGKYYRSRQKKKSGSELCMDTNTYEKPSNLNGSYYENTTINFNDDVKIADYFEGLFPSMFDNEYSSIQGKEDENEKQQHYVSNDVYKSIAASATLHSNSDNRKIDDANCISNLTVPVKSLNVGKKLHNNKSHKKLNINESLNENITFVTMKVNRETTVKDILSQAAQEKSELLFRYIFLIEMFRI